MWHWGDPFSRWQSSRLGMIWEFWAVRMPQLATLLFSGAKLLKEDCNIYFLHSGTPTQEWQDWHTWTTTNPRTFWCSRERLRIKIYPTPSLTWLVIFILSVYWGKSFLYSSLSGERQKGSEDNNTRVGGHGVWRQSSWRLHRRGGDIPRHHRDATGCDAGCQDCHGDENQCHGMDSQIEYIMNIKITVVVNMSTIMSHFHRATNYSCSKVTDQFSVFTVDQLRQTIKHCNKNDINQDWTLQINTREYLSLNSDIFFPGFEGKVHLKTRLCGIGKHNGNTWLVVAIMRIMVTNGVCTL